MRGGGRSAAGLADARFPPMVARLRTSGDPSAFAPAQSALHFFPINSEASISATVKQEPIFNTSEDESSFFNSSILAIETNRSGEISFFFMLTIRSVPPAITLAFTAYSAIIWQASANVAGS